MKKNKNNYGSNPLVILIQGKSPTPGANEKPELNLDTFWH